MAGATIKLDPENQKAAKRYRKDSPVKVSLNATCNAAMREGFRVMNAPNPNHTCQTNPQKSRR